VTASADNPARDRELMTSEVRLELLSQVHWSSVLDSVGTGISIHSGTSEIVWANKWLCDVYGKPLSDLRGMSCQQIFHGEASPCAHDEVLTTGRAVKLEHDILLSGRSLSVTIEPLFDESAKTIGFARISRDVTELRFLQEQLLKAERFATLGQMLYGFAHNVGTPLNIISGYAEFLLMRSESDDAGHKELSAILNQTRRIASLFSEALDLARLPQGRIEAVDIRALLADSIDLVGHFLRKTDVKTTLTCANSPPLIYGEAPQLRQAFFNLLLNAGQQTGYGGKLEIVIEMSPDAPGFLALSLWGTDASGQGLDFCHGLGRFFDDRVETEAPGLGLSLTKDILNNAGARITSLAAGERGAPLIVYLPVSRSSLS